MLPGIVAARSCECQRRRPQTRRLNSSFESRRPRVVRTTRSSSVTSSSSAASAQPNDVGEGRLVRRRQRDAAIRPQAEDDGLGGRRRRVDRLRAAGGQARRAAIGWRERAEVALEARRVPASGHAVERVRARPDGLVRPALPVHEVVPALVAGPRPVADLVAVPAGLGQAMSGVVVLAGGAILVLARAARAARQRRAPGGRRQVVAAWRRSAPPHPGRRGSARTATGGRARARGPPRGSSIQSASDASGHVVQQVEADRSDAGRSRLGDGPHDVDDPVPSTEPAESGGGHRLGADRQPGHAGRPQPPGVAALVRPRVGLERDLGPVGQAEAIADEVEQPGRWRRPAAATASHRPR